MRGGTVKLDIVDSYEAYRAMKRRGIVRSSWKPGGPTVSLQEL